MLIFAACLVIWSACAPAPRSSGTTAPSGQQPAGRPAGERKTIVFGVTGQINAFSLSEIGSGGAGRALAELWLQGLVTSGLKTQAPEARIAAEVRSEERRVGEEARAGWWPTPREVNRMAFDPTAMSPCARHAPTP